MRLFLAFVLALAASGAALAQGYRPAPNETVLKVAVEGRGNIFIRLYPNKAPKACTRIVQLVREGFYDGQRFFRVTRSPRPYIAQAGDPASRGGVDDPSIGSGGSGVKIAYEDSGLGNDKYAVGLAAPVAKDRDSGDSQFYIVLGDGNRFLDGSYTVFGKVVAGFDVVDRLEKGDRIVSIAIL